jgi:glycosyltransferase involved in cell wall biosynthesis
MTIAIDCRMIDSSGIGVYLKGCLASMLQTDYSFLLLGNREKLRSYFANQNVRIIECDIKPFSIKETFFFPSKITKKINKASVYFSPYFNVPHGINIPIFTVIHDIIFPDMPELTSKSGLAGRMWFYRRCHKKSQKIFTVSRFSKSRIELHLGKDKPVIVTYSALQSMFTEYWIKAQRAAKAPKTSQTQTPEKKETIVFIGNIKKHKGLDCLIDAFSRAKNDGLPHKLIIIGSKENFRSSDKAILKEIELLGNAVIFSGSIPDQKLIECLSEASLLVQPSLYEGFGLPPLEAMALGTNALISDIPVFKEIYEGFPVTFFKTGNSTDLRNKMNTILYKKLPPPVLTQEHINKYTFQKTTAAILKELQ